MDQLYRDLEVPIIRERMERATMSELRRYNLVSMIIGKPTNHEFEESGVGQIVFASNALTVIREKDERIAELKAENSKLRKQIANLEPTVNTALETVAGLQRELNSKKAEWNECLSKIDTLIGTLDTKQ